MKPNMGSTDKLIRLIAAALIVILLVAKVITLNTLGIILLVIAAVLVLTSLVSFCPLYTLLKCDTLKKK